MLWVQFIETENLRAFRFPTQFFILAIGKPPYSFMAKASCHPYTSKFDYILVIREMIRLIMLTNKVMIDAMTANDTKMEFLTSIESET